MFDKQETIVSKPEEEGGGELEMRQLETLKADLNGLEEATRESDPEKLSPEKISGFKKRAAVLVLAFAALFAVAPETKAQNVGNLIYQGSYIYQTYEQYANQRKQMQMQARQQEQQMQMQARQMDAQAKQQEQQMRMQARQQEQQMEMQRKAQESQQNAQKDQSQEQRKIQQDQQRAEFCREIINNPRLTENPALAKSVNACTEYFLHPADASEEPPAAKTQKASK